MAPTFAHGKICYIEMPATDISRSAEFYRQVFGWKIRKRGDGSTAFDDGVGQVSGTWLLGRPLSPTPGLLIYIMVDSVATTCDAIIAAGGEIVQPIGATRRRSPRDSAIQGAMCSACISNQGDEAYPHTSRSRASSNDPLDGCRRSGSSRWACRLRQSRPAKYVVTTLCTAYRSSRTSLLRRFELASLAVSFSGAPRI